MKKVIEKIPRFVLIILNIIILCLIVGLIVVTIKPEITQGFRNSSEQNPSLIKEVAEKIYNSCLYQEREKCYKKEFEKPTKEKGLLFSEKVLYSLQNLDPQLRHCHVLSHAISQIATRNQPKKWMELLQIVDVSTCGAGFFHGILEAHVGDDPNFEINPETIKEICVPDNTMDFKARTCAHILGHLVLVENRGKVDEGLVTCRDLPNELALECGTGVFMEDSFKTGLFEHDLVDSLPVRDKERLDRQTKRCRKYSGTEGVACWTDLAELIVEYYNYDPKPSFSGCYSAPTKAEGDACYLKGVILMAVSPKYDEKEKLTSACMPFKDDRGYFERCVNFMVSSLMYYSPKFIDRGNTLCSNIPENHKGKCFKELGRMLQMNVKSVEDRREFCKVIPEKYMSDCLQEK